MGEKKRVKKSVEKWEKERKRRLKIVCNDRELENWDGIHTLPHLSFVWDDSLEEADIV